MTDHAPIDQPIVEILNQYNPLEIKDILLHGSWRKAVHHKEWDKVLAYYKDNIDYMHHYLLDSPDAWNHYAIMQKAYTMTDHTPADQKETSKTYSIYTLTCLHLTLDTSGTYTADQERRSKTRY